MLKFPRPAQVLRTLYISSHRLQTGVPSRGMNYSKLISEMNMSIEIKYLMHTALKETKTKMAHYDEIFLA